MIPKEETKYTEFYENMTLFERKEWLGRVLREVVLNRKGEIVDVCVSPESYKIIDQMRHRKKWE